MIVELHYIHFLSIPPPVHFQIHMLHPFIIHFPSNDYKVIKANATAKAAAMSWISVEPTLLPTT
jgi:hypothetical protein